MDASVTEEPVLNIFVDSSGIPLRIFVEDSPLGPTLVNRLKVSAYHAQVPSCAVSYHFVDSWSKDHPHNSERTVHHYRIKLLQRPSLRKES